jgi:hypothetical protein
VCVHARMVIGQALVRYSPATVVTAYSQDFSTRAHAAVWSVVENIAFECAWGVQREAGSFQPLVETGQVTDFEFDLGLDSHRNQRVYGRGLRASKVSAKCGGQARQPATIKE